MCIQSFRLEIKCVSDFSFPYFSVILLTVSRLLFLTSFLLHSFITSCCLTELVTVLHVSYAKIDLSLRKFFPIIWLFPSIEVFFHGILCPSTLGWSFIIYLSLTHSSLFLSPSIFFTLSMSLFCSLSLSHFVYIELIESGNHHGPNISVRMEQLKRRFADLDALANKRLKKLKENSDYLQFVWKCDVVESWIGQLVAFFESYRFFVHISLFLFWYIDVNEILNQDFIFVFMRICYWVFHTKLF